MFGLLNLNKPPGWTSRDVVNRVQRMLRKVKVGHAGTLDPLASGVLVLCLGPATRLIEYVQKGAKQYRAVFLLGRTSDTEDVSGQVAELTDPPIPSQERIEKVLGRFIGRILQRPPAFSALKVDGRRAYKLARRGETPQLSPRPIDIYRLELIEFIYPRLELAVTCGSGTYVRSLGRDIAEALGTGAVMAELVRTAVGPFRLEESIEPDRLTGENLADFLLPPETAVASLPKMQLDEEQRHRIGCGLPIEVDSPIGKSGPVAALDSSGRLAAVLVSPSPGLWTPTKVFFRNEPPQGL